MVTTKHELARDFSTETKQTQHERADEIPPMLEGVTHQLVQIHKRNGDLDWLKKLIEEADGGGQGEELTERTANLPPENAGQNQNALANHSEGVQNAHEGKADAKLPQDGGKHNNGPQSGIGKEVDSQNNNDEAARLLEQQGGKKEPQPQGAAKPQTTGQAKPADNAGKNTVPHKTK